MLQHQVRTVIIHWSMIIVNENENIFCYQHVYCSIHFIAACKPICLSLSTCLSLYMCICTVTPVTFLNNIISTHQLTCSKSRYWTPHSRGHQFTFQNQDDPLLLFCSPSKLCSLWSVLPVLDCRNANINTG